MVDRVRIILLKSSLIAMQNLIVAVYHTVCAHVGGGKKLGDAEAPARLSWERGVADPIETRSCSTSVTTPNILALR